MSRLAAGRGAAALVALAMVGYALMQLSRAGSGVAVERGWLGPTPVSVYRATRAPQAQRPVVVVAHGFAGSQQLMQAFAYTLARNGFTAVTFDFHGHGRNLERLAGDVTSIGGATRALVAQTRAVADHVLDARGWTGADAPLAVLGHSMAADIVVRYARSDPRVRATVAVSMLSPAVTAEAPRNLLVVVGGLERFLEREALRVLGLVTDDPRPARTAGDFAAGTARRVAVAPGAGHVGVLYHRESLREAVRWLEQAFAADGARVQATPIAVDRRGPAIVLLLAGLVLLAWPLTALLPAVSESPRGASLGWRRLLPAAFLPALATPLLLAWFPADFLSVPVGGYLAVHFGVYGLITAACLWWLRSRAAARRAGAEPPPRAGCGVVAALCAGAYAAGLIALALDTYVTSFAITAPRIPLVLAMLAGTASYFFADEWLTRGADTPRGAHLVTRAAFLLSLALAVALSLEELFFLLVIAAVILVYFVVYGLLGTWIYRATGHPFVGAAVNAVAFAWALAVVFPMLSG